VTIDAQVHQIAAHLRMKTSPEPARIAPVAAPLSRWRVRVLRDEAGLIVEVVAERID
jgi:hypothetical protein